MTAMSAPSAPNAPTAANTSADLAPIRLPGSDRTYEHRDFLRSLGLRWDPVGHAWHGLLAAAARQELATQFGLLPRIIRPIESFQEIMLERKGEPNPSPTIPSRSTVVLHLPRDSSRTRFESRLAFGPFRDRPLPSMGRGGSGASTGPFRWTQ
jgi:hypothetical protein